MNSNKILNLLTQLYRLWLSYIQTVLDSLLNIKTDWKFLNIWKYNIRLLFIFIWTLGPKQTDMVVFRLHKSFLMSFNVRNWEILKAYARNWESVTSTTFSCVTASTDTPVTQKEEIMVFIKLLFIQRHNIFADHT